MTYTTGIDIGGTFTDTVVMDESGSVAVYKTPTTPAGSWTGCWRTSRPLPNRRGWTSSGSAPGRAHRARNDRRDQRLPRAPRRETRLLTPRGSRKTIFMQRMLGMITGRRPLELRRFRCEACSEPLCPRSLVFGIRERMDFRGDVTIGPLREDDVRAAAAVIAAADVEAVAVCFLWSFENPAHEERAAEILRAKLPDTYVSVSSAPSAPWGVRAHSDDALRRLPRAARGALHRRPRGAAERHGDLPARLGRRGNDPRPGRARAGPAAALWSVGRGDRVAVSRRRTPASQHHHVRHGRYVHRCRADRRRRAAAPS